MLTSCKKGKKFSFYQKKITAVSNYAAVQLTETIKKEIKQLVNFRVLSFKPIWYKKSAATGSEKKVSRVI